MANVFTREFWAASAERAVKTAAQSAVTLIGADQIHILSLDWAEILGVTATMTLLSILTSITGDVSRKNGPSFVKSEGIGIESAEAEQALLEKLAAAESADDVADVFDEFEDDDQDETDFEFDVEFSEADLDAAELDDDDDGPAPKH